MISIIVAMGENREIGKDNSMLWNIKEEMQLFRNITIHSTVVMGRKTYDSIGMPLKNRKNIVLTKNKELKNDKIFYTEDIESIINEYKDSEEEIFIIGGEKIYNIFIPFAKRLYLSYIKEKFDDATAFFPKINYNEYKKLYEYEYDKFIFRIYEKEI